MGPGGPQVSSCAAVGRDSLYKRGVTWCLPRRVGLILARTLRLLSPKGKLFAVVNGPQEKCVVYKIKLQSN